MYLTKCRRCGVAIDFDADRSTNPHGHGREPRGWAPGGMGPGHPGEARGTRCRVLQDVVQGDKPILVPGDVVTVLSTSPEHHSANGGGYDIHVAFGTDHYSIWSRWLEVIE